LFNAEEAEEWAHLDYLEAKLGEWRDRHVLPAEKVEELLALTDGELATLEDILGIEPERESTGATRRNRPGGSAATPDEDRVLDAVDDALARGDPSDAERLLDSVEIPRGVDQSDQPPADGPEFEPVQTEVGVDMLFLVTAEADGSSEGDYFSRAIVYAASEGEARQRVCSYIDLSNEAAAARSSQEENADSEEGHLAQESKEDEEEEEDEEDSDSDEDDGPIQYDPHVMTVTLVATTTTRLEDESMFDADNILIFETARGGGE
jgi:hypothetical protein